MKIGNVEMRVNEATRRDWETIKEASREFFARFNWLQLVIIAIASFITAAIMVAPWLADDSELLWK